MKASPASRFSGEDGAVAVISALILTVLLLFAALAIDLGALRADRSVGQSVSDMAAAAAGRVYESNAPGSARQACLQAVAYAERNLDVTLAPVGDGCDGFDPSEVCSSAAWDPAVYEADGIRLTVTIPVADASPLMQGASYGPEIDGSACQRVGVTVTQDRDFLLAGAGGAIREGSTNVSAVARAQGPGDLGQFASLIILQQVVTGSSDACDVLRAQGTQGQGTEPNRIRVIGGTFNNQYYPGIITVDTERESTCQSSQKLIEGGGGGLVFASDEIFSHHLREFPGTDSDVYQGNVVAEGAPGQTPRAGRRITRAPVDHLYNCLDVYPPNQLWSPNHSDSVSTAGACEESGVVPPYLKDLYDSYQFLTAEEAQSDGWGVITGAQCTKLTGTFGPAAIGGETKWFIDCPGTGTEGTGQGFRPTDVHFDGVEAVVTRGRILTNGDQFRVTGAGGTGAVLYVQEGKIDGRSTSSYVLRDTFVYTHDGALQISAQASVDWQAPIGNSSACDLYDDAYSFSGSNDAPPAICFGPLALWSNASDEHFMGGGGQVVTAGSFFTPNAPFRIVGGSGNDFRRSQFFSARLRTSGGGTLEMIPNPDTNIEIPLLGPSLIR